MRGTACSNKPVGFSLRASGPQMKRVFLEVTTGVGWVFFEVRRGRLGFCLRLGGVGWVFFEVRRGRLGFF